MILACLLLLQINTNNYLFKLLFIDEQDLHLLLDPTI